MALPTVNSARDVFLADPPKSYSKIYSGEDDAGEPYILRLMINAVAQTVTADIRGQDSKVLDAGATYDWAVLVAAAVETALWP